MSSQWIQFSVNLKRKKVQDFRPNCKIAKFPPSTCFKYNFFPLPKMKCCHIHHKFSFKKFSKSNLRNLTHMSKKKLKILKILWVICSTYKALPNECKLKFHKQVSKKCKVHVEIQDFFHKCATYYHEFKCITYNIKQKSQTYILALFQLFQISSSCL